MRSAVLSVLSILLMLAGVLVPIGFESVEGGGLSLVLGTRAFAYQAGDGVWATRLGEGESRSFAIQAAVPIASPIPMENLEKQVPGDADPEETGFRFTYTGSDPVILYLTTETSGELTTCDGGDKFRVTIRDDEGNLYSHDEANQEVRQLEQGDEVTFRTVRQFDLSAGNDCQNKTALFTLQATVVQVDEPPTERPPSNPPPSSTPETPRGSITVRVIDGTNGASTPLNGATVTLPDGTTGQTNQAGEITFPNLILGSYLVRAEAEDPLQPGSNNMASGSGTVSVDQTDLNPTITVVLAWQRPLAPPTPPTPPTPQPPSPPTPTPPPPAPFQGSIRVRVLDASPHTGGLPAPIPNATVQLNGGQTRPTDPTGVALFEGLQPGEYTVWVEARNPRNPSDDVHGGSATVRVTREEANAEVTVLLVWDEVAAPPGPTGPAEPSTPPGPTPAAPAGRGLLAGRICAPGQPGAEIVATSAKGKRAAIFIGTDGTLGQWRPYLLENMEAGDWEISLQAPGSGTARQKVTVKAGETTQVPDFTLACTGEAAPGDSNLWTYLVGGLLMAAGLVIRRYAEAK